MPSTLKKFCKQFESYRYEPLVRVLLAPPQPWNKATQRKINVHDWGAQQRENQSFHANHLDSSCKVFACLINVLQSVSLFRHGGRVRVSN